MCIRDRERGGRHTNELDWTRISSTWGWVSSLRSRRLQSQTSYIMYSAEADVTPRRLAVVPCRLFGARQLSPASATLPGLPCNSGAQHMGLKAAELAQEADRSRNGQENAPPATQENASSATAPAAAPPHRSSTAAFPALGITAPAEGGGVGRRDIVDGVGGRAPGGSRPTCRLQAEAVWSCPGRR